MAKTTRRTIKIERHAPTLVDIEPEPDVKSKAFRDQLRSRIRSELGATHPDWRADVLASRVAKEFRRRIRDLDPEGEAERQALRHFEESVEIQHPEWTYRQVQLHAQYLYAHRDD